ncbi:MAG: hypothetical protein EOQ59_26100 [Mesorhizobium sp.]|uniref:hypothetical protein n=1 Tax=Mesorhizobium sp. TaxID=1871066 RepID=UPI000FEA7BBC|nr:hypothetical protein [Mesorhizobium sp.]RWG28648.1 MAG: hypothetical protein EOQ59_26100 [Mesorhizobium sp.]RWG73616.1 MAG: hypothetical protein EOQ66_07805 [Mesorhizobium sp.]TIN56314.1 MAG: hypothetical protein E5Y24_10330 [Mesorhizobium sp.]TIR75793.1 MAG: hypothetical protein E5X18_06835 [Mesorhizobium sp.]TIS11442.1 MAG: hypothetical protein E5X09_13060 [Mesorhizobium sp.]
MIKDLVAWREAGYVKTVGKILDEARANPDAGSAAETIADCQAWFDWAVQYEREHGVDSLVNEQHPIHLEVMRMMRSVKRVGLMVEGDQTADRIAD